MTRTKAATILLFHAFLAGCLPNEGPGGSASTSDGDTSEGSTSTGEATAVSTGGEQTSGDLTTGDASSSGNDTSTSSARDPFCGDGVVDAGEECDDGNAEDGDACLSSCVLAKCGDGFVWEGTEECDDGNGIDMDACLPSCMWAKCGDGIVHLDVEECDDGNDVDNDGCTSSCFAERLVFVTSEQYDGRLLKFGEMLPPMDLSGVALADFRCATLAASQGYAGEYKAWVSAMDEGPVSRFGYSPDFFGHFVLPSGEAVAFGWEDLRDGWLYQPIYLDETNAPVTGAVWTGTSYSGHPALYTCKGWTTADVTENGVLGSSAGIDQTWSSANTGSCGSMARLFCVQVAPA